MSSELYGEKHMGSEEISGHEGHRKERSCEGGAHHSRMESQVSDTPEIKTHWKNKMP